MVRGRRLGSQNLFSIEKGGAAGKLWGEGGHSQCALQDNKARSVLCEVLVYPAGAGGVGMRGVGVRGRRSEESKAGLVL